jgi:hypothetical protein
MPKQSFADLMTDWEKLLAAVVANQTDLPYIDGYKQQLEVEMTGAKAASLRQSASQAVAQQASRDLEGFIQRGQDLASRIRGGVRSKYGIKGEKLKEFGLKVFRGGKKKGSPKKSPPTVGPPPAARPAETKEALQAATTEE